MSENLALNPDQLKGIPECLNFTRDIYCKNQIKQVICYTSFLGLYIQDMLSGPTARSKDNFIEDFVRRLGGKQVIDVNDIVAQFKESIKQICGESVNEIDSMYNQMKQKVEEVSTSMYDIQTKDCGLGKVKPYSEIKVFDEVVCKNNKVIVPIEEKLDLTICDTGGNPYGIEVDLSGKFNQITTKSSEFKEDNPDVVYISGGISSSAKTNSPNKFLIGEAPTSSSSNTIYLKTYLDCSDYINKEDFKDKKTLKQKVKDCITLKYKTNVQWKLITFQKDQTGREIIYTENGDLDDKAKSENVPRQINTNIKFDNTCSQTTTSQTQESQQLIVKVDCSNPNEPKLLNNLNINLPNDLIKSSCSCDKNKDKIATIKINPSTKKMMCAE